MKKIVSAFLAAVICFCAFPAWAAECNHTYSSEHFEATCISREKTVYTCTLCGDSYEETNPLYTAPDSFYVAVTGERIGDRLTVIVSLDNNPGLWSTAFKLYYNTEALTYVSAEGGEVWKGLQCTVNHNPTGYVSMLGSDSGLENNYRNGTLLIANFDIKGEPAQWGFNLKNSKMDFINCDSQAQTFKKFVCVADGYGDHILGDGAVTAEPTVYDEGTITYSCIHCNYMENESIPVLEKQDKCDVDNDGTISARDVFFLMLYIKNGVPYGSPQFDAADVSNDRQLSALDILLLIEAVKYGYNEE